MFVSRLHRACALPPFLFILGLASACDVDPDRTATAACKDVKCPVGTAINMVAESGTDCEEQAGIDSGRCFVKGSCVYLCKPSVKCCGAETWTTESYSCTTACCADGNPPPCEYACGDGQCDPGETPASCAVDCDDTCGDGDCTGGENPTLCPQDCDPAWRCSPASEGASCGSDKCGDYGECAYETPCATTGKHCRTCTNADRLVCK